MLPAEALRRWLAEGGGPTDALEHPLGRAYRRFYGLGMPLTRHEMGAVRVHNESIFVQFYSARKSPIGTVFLLHGYLDHSGLQARSIQHLLGLGFNVVAIDHAGHGLSTGERASVDDFSLYVDSVSAAHAHYQASPQPHILIGHSLGGAVSMTHLLQHPHAFKKAVLIAPLFRPKAWRVIRVAHVLGRRMVRSQPRFWRENTRDQDYRHFIKDVDPLSPRAIPVAWVSAMFRWIANFEALEPVDAQVLVVQGTNDGTVDWRGNLSMIRAKFADVKIHIVQEGKHQLLNEVDGWREKTWQPIDPFLMEHL